MPLTMFFPGLILAFLGIVFAALSVFKPSKTYIIHAVIWSLTGVMLLSGGIGKSDARPTMIGSFCLFAAVIYLVSAMITKDQKKRSFR